MDNMMNSPINEVRESNENTLDVFKDKLAEKKETFQFMTDIPTKTSVIKRMYEAKKHQAKKNILFEWPNQAIRKIIQKHQLVVLRNNAYYIGGIANNVIHGKGLAIYSQQRFYQGEFQNNYKHGQGVQCLPTGTYMGGYVNNKPEGKGIFVSKEGDRYEGQFRAGMKHGKGIWVSAKHSYSGDWRGNKPNGHGKIKTIESQYQGMVSDGLKHGEGKEVFANEDVYSGEYYNGRPEGNGVYFWNKTGSVYKGQFKNGLRHGQGTWKQNGDVYSGEFSNDKKNGYGHFIWASGNEYEGAFFEDIIHGQGCMKWTDGSWYKGNWLYGVQNGYGQIQQIGQPLKKGIFQNNCLVLQEDFSTHSISKKIKLQRLSYRREKQKEKQKEKVKQHQNYVKKQRYAHQLQQFQTESQYSKKILPSHNNSFFHRSNKPFQRRRVLTLKSEELKKSIEHLKPHHSHGKTQSFSEGEEVRLIDWRRMKALKPL